MKPSIYLNCIVLFTAVSSVLFPIPAYLGVIALIIMVVWHDKGHLLLKQIKNDKAIILGISAAVISTVASKAILLSIAADFLILLQICYYTILLIYFQSANQERFYKLLQVTTIISCSIGLYQYATGNLINDGSWIDQRVYGSSFVRIYSTFYNPNVFAGYLYVNICFCLCSILQNKRDWINLLSLVLSSMCMVLTYSRGGYIALLSASAFIYLFKKDKKILFYIAIMAAALYISNYSSGVSRISLTNIYQEGSSIYRLEIWRTCFKIFEQNFLFGNGVGTLWYFITASSDKLWGHIYHAHNIYIHIAAECGIIGILAGLIFLCSNAKNIYRVFINNDQSENLYIIEGFSAASIAVMIHGLIDAVIIAPNLSLVLVNYFALYKSTFSKTELINKNVSSTLEISHSEIKQAI